MLSLTISLSDVIDCKIVLSCVSTAGFINQCQWWDSGRPWDTFCYAINTSRTGRTRRHFANISDEFSWFMFIIHCIFLQMSFSLVSNWILISIGSVNNLMPNKRKTLLQLLLYSATDIRDGPQWVKLYYGNGSRHQMNNWFLAHSSGYHGMFDGCYPMYMSCNITLARLAIV